MNPLRFRQVHLDFHTSGKIENIGGEFDKQQFQEALKIGFVNSVTLFSKCHHGYSYHPTKVSTMHPNLKIDLLQAQIDACKEIGVNTVIYISAGLDENEAIRHPEWLARNKDETTMGNKDFYSRAGYHVLCYNTPYLDLLLEQTKEVMENYKPEALFFDISSVRKCYCSRCRLDILEKGLDIRDNDIVLEQAEEVYANYTLKLEQLIHSYNPNTAIFHNGGHITRGRRDLALYNTHLELESLPTGGWGYDHFPMSASYAMTLGMEYMGMTGKFHSSWGEFGGYKHPNALRYETALSLAFGAKCSIGDQLHPNGKIDMPTYQLIGKAYREVEAKEEWCYNARNLADIAILSEEAINSKNSDLTVKHFGDIGANRIMLEGKYLYHIIDDQADFYQYKLIILPDSIRLNKDLQSKIMEYMERGGKILSTGLSGLKADEDSFAVELGVKYKGKSVYRPDYIRTNFETVNNGAAFVMYGQGHDIELESAQEIATKEASFFNRGVEAFCSHQHTPNIPQSAGTGIAVTENTAYIAWDIFSDYAQMGSLHLKEIVVYVIDLLLKDNKTVITTLPDKAIITLTLQESNNRYVNHVLFAHTTKRGKYVQNEQIGGDIEIIESIVPLYDIPVSLKIEKRIKSVSLVPTGTEIKYTQDNDYVSYIIPRIECHQMVVLEY